MRWLLMIVLIALPMLSAPMLFIPPATALSSWDGCPLRWTLIGTPYPGQGPDHNGDGYLCQGPADPSPPSDHIPPGPPEEVGAIIDNNVPSRAT